MLTQLILSLSLASPTPEWELVDPGVATSIRGISAVDAQTCWVGTKAGVARTTDGGKTWTFSKIGGDELDFRDLHAFDAQRCVAMSAGSGAASRLYLTADGGKTWKLTYQNLADKAFFNGIAFRDERHGVLAGDPLDGRLFLLATRDGGASWQRIAKDTAPEMGEGEHAFAASGTHLAVNQDGHIWVSSGGKVARVFRSKDWGETWETITTPMIAGRASTGIFSIDIAGKQGVAVGGDYEREGAGMDNAMRSSDGGRTWKLIGGEEGSAPFHFRSCVGFVDRMTLVAVGPSGTDISRDGGETWSALSTRVGFHTLSIAAETVWAAGSDGRVGHLRLRKPVEPKD